MSALAISLICIAAMTSALMFHDKNYRTAKALFETQDNARLAMIYLKNAIESAGFVGCNHIENMDILSQGVKKINNFNQENAFKIYSENNSLVDVIETHHLAGLTTNLKEPFLGGTEMITEANPAFSNNNDPMIADGEKALLFQAESVSRSVISDEQHILSTTVLNAHFDSSAEIGKIITAIFFVQSTGRKDSRGNEINALYVKDETNRSEELIPGVTEFKASRNGRMIKINLTLQSVDEEDQNESPLKQSIEMWVQLKNINNVVL